MTKIDYEMAVEVYRNTPGVSQSQLKYLARSPRHFKHALEHPIETTDAMAFGSLVDSLFFGTEFRWIESPYDDFRSGEAKAWRKAQEESGIWVFKRGIVAEAKQIIESLISRQAVNELIQDGYPQVAMFAEMEGVQCKGLADWVCDSIDVIPDLKTTGKAAGTTIMLDSADGAGLTSSDEWSRTIVNMGYDVQAAFYLDLFKACTGEERQFWWIVAESEPPHEVAVWAATQDVIERGRRIYRSRLATYRQCMERNEWPGYPDRVQYAGLPAWAK